MCSHRPWDNQNRQGTSMVRLVPLVGSFDRFAPACTERESIQMMWMWKPLKRIGTWNYWEGDREDYWEGHKWYHGQATCTRSEFELAFQHPFLCSFASTSDVVTLYTGTHQLWRLSGGGSNGLGISKQFSAIFSSSSEGICRCTYWFCRFRTWGPCVASMPKQWDKNSWRHSIQKDPVEEAMGCGTSGVLFHLRKTSNTWVTQKQKCPCGTQSFTLTIWESEWLYCRKLCFHGAYGRRKKKRSSQTQSLQLYLSYPLVQNKKLGIHLVH